MKLLCSNDASFGNSFEPKILHYLIWQKLSTNESNGTNAIELKNKTSTTAKVVCNDLNTI
jgi:hypothetical protein